MATLKRLRPRRFPSFPLLAAPPPRLLCRSAPSSFLQASSRSGMAPLPLQHTCCRLSPYTLLMSARGVQSEVLRAAEGNSYEEDLEMQAAASAFQAYLQNASKAYFSDAASVVANAPVFLRRFLDSSKQETPSHAQSKGLTEGKIEQSSDALGGLSLSKKMEAFVAESAFHALEPVLESVGITSERLNVIAKRLSTETTDIKSLLFAVRALEKLGISRNEVGDMIEKECTVVSRTSDEIEASFNGLKALVLSEEKVLDLIKMHPVILKHQVMENIKSLSEEAGDFPSKDIIIRKLVCDNPQGIHDYLKGRAKGVGRYLKSYGFTTEKLDAILRRHFRLLLLDVETQIKRNVQFLRDLGLSRDAVGKVMEKCPSFLFQSVEVDLIGRLEYFKSLGMNDAEFAIVISRYPRVLTVNLESKIKPMISELQMMGLSEEGLKKVVMYRPSVFAEKVGGNVSNLVRELKEANYSQNRKVTAFIKLYSRGTDQRKKCEDCLVQHGLSASDAKQMVDKEPGILGYKESALSAKLDNLTKTLGIPIENVVTVPEYLSFGLKKRVLRRQRVLSYMKMKGLLTDTLSLKQLVSPSNAQFYSRFLKSHADNKELDKLWFKNQAGVGTVDGLNFLMNSPGGAVKAEIH